MRYVLRYMYEIVEIVFILFCYDLVIIDFVGIINVDLNLLCILLGCIISFDFWVLCCS